MTWLTYLWGSSSSNESKNDTELIHVKNSENQSTIIENASRHDEDIGVDIEIESAEIGKIDCDKPTFLEKIKILDDLLANRQPKIEVLLYINWPIIFDMYRITPKNPVEIVKCDPKVASLVAFEKMLGNISDQPVECTISEVSRNEYLRDVFVSELQKKFPNIDLSIKNDTEYLTNLHNVEIVVPKLNSRPKKNRNKNKKI